MENQAVVYQINQQVQKIAWQINFINQLFGKQLLNQVKKNPYYIPPIHNIDLTYTNQENPKVLDMFKRNPLLTSVWHQVSKATLEQLNEIELQQIEYASQVDFTWKAIKYDDLVEGSRWMQIGSIYYGFTYDGLLYDTSNNSTYQNYQIPHDCPYVGPYKLDIRCRFYYQPTIDSISTVIFSPQINYGYGSQYFASNFCQRRAKYENQNPNSDSYIYSLLCITLNLQIIPSYFINFSQNSKFQMLLDPKNLTVVYFSEIQQSYSQILNVEDVETKYLQDQNQSKIFLDQISQNSNDILLKTNQIDLSQILQNTQKTFEYNRNGTDCFAILNIITIVDKVPSYETKKLFQPSEKFQLKTVYLFLDVLSKENMLVYAQDLQNTISYYNQIFTYTIWGIFIIILVFQICYSIQLGIHLLHPVIHLTQLLKQIRFLNTKKIENSLHNINFQTNQNVTSIIIQKTQNYETQSEFDNQVQIDEQIDINFDGVCFSKDTQDLLNSFQNLFKILRFTTQNFFKDNESTSLLNLNGQIQHFKLFGNFRALGVCYNNMGVIHYNCERYQEALENFEKSIIYSKYELSLYSHENNALDIYSKLDAYTSKLRFIFQNQFNKNDNRIILIDFLEEIKSNNKNNQLTQEAEQLFWNLFNRNLNYQNALSYYIQQNEFNLWDIFENIVLENIVVSLLYLPASYKREIINYYILLKGRFQSKTNNQNDFILNILTQNYINIYEAKECKKPKLIPQFSHLSHTKIQNQAMLKEYLIQQNKILVRSNGSHHNNESILLLSPIQRFNMSGTRRSQRQLSQKFQNNFNLDFNPRSRTSGAKNRTSLFNSHSPLKNQIFKQEIESNKVNACEREQSINNFKSPKVKNEKGDEENHLMSVQDTQTYDQQINNCHSVQKPEPDKDFLVTEKKDDQQINRQTQISIKNKQENLIEQFYNSRKEIQNIDLIEEEQESFDNYPQYNHYQKLQKFIKERQFVYQMQQRSKDGFYKIRKEKKLNQQNIYDYCSDIYFQYCTIQQAQFQIQQKNYYNAALIINNSLEQCKYYLPYLKKMEMAILSQIFKENDIQSRELDDKINKYNVQKNSSFNVYIVSTCYNRYFKKRFYALCNDLVNQVLFKQSDSLGILLYSFEENIYNQFLSKTSIKTIHSNHQFFTDIFLGLLFKKVINLPERFNLRRNGRQISIMKHFNSKQNIQQLQTKQKIKENQNSNHQVFTKNNFEDKQNSKHFLKNNYLNQDSNYNFRLDSFFFETPQQKKFSLTNQKFINNSIQQYNETQNTLKQPQLTEYSFDSVFTLPINENSEMIQDSSNINNNNNQKQLDNYQKKRLNSQSIQNSINNTQNETLQTSFSQSNAINDNNKAIYIFQAAKNQLELIGDTDQDIQLNILQESPSLNSNQKLLLQIMNSNKKIIQDQVKSINNSEQSIQKRESCQDSNITSKQKSLSQNTRTAIKRQTGEQVFLQGVETCIQQFILNSSKKQSIFVTQCKYNQCYLQQSYFYKNYYTYLIYYTDQSLNFTDRNKFQRLCKLLINLDIELLILILNETQNLQEHSSMQNIHQNGRQIITFFSSEEKLLQYIYNNREHIKNNFSPMVVEHF
ncbi:hypothetical protein ABPG74_020476 [Tetrahymena malaccensis]